MIRVGDKVRIVEPIVVLRVGYPLGVEDGLKFVRETMGKQIDALFDAGTRTKMDLVHFHLSAPQIDIYTREKIERALGYRWLYQQNFGGNTRSLHLKLVEELRGREAFVTALNTRITGTRCPGYMDQTGESEGPFLSDQKYHRIAELDLWGGSVSELHTIGSEAFVHVGVCHLEKV